MNTFVNRESFRLARTLTRVRSLVFGDRIGVALFLGSLCWFALTWRVGFFITDSYAVANTLVNVADGHLYLDRIEYSLTLGSSQPGLHIHDGRVYGRNYGQVYLALPVYLLLDSLSVIVDLRIAMTGLFSLALLGCAHQIGGALDRRPLAVGIGSVLAVMTFGLSLFVATALPVRWAGLLALQATTMVAGAVLALVLYRLAGGMYDRRVGIAAGVVVVVATPIGFWATIPKRHALTAALAMVTVACFYASRGRTDRYGRLARGGAYLAAGFATSVHSVEGFVFLGALVPLDLLTAPSNGRRDLAVVGVAVLAGLAPFLLTNVLITGNPLLAPRWLSGFGGGTIGPDGFVQVGTDQGGSGPDPVVNETTQVSTGGTEIQPDGRTEIQPDGGADTPSGGGADTGGKTPETGGEDGVPGVKPLMTILSTVIAGASLAIRYFQRTIDLVFDFDRLYHIFVRSGRIPGVKYKLNNESVVELTLLESMPLFGTVVLGIGTFVSWLGGRFGAWLRRGIGRPREILDSIQGARKEPIVATDLLVGAYLVALTLVYLPRLPLFSQITVRYLVPTVPLWLYLLVRIRPVRRSVAAAPHVTGMAYLAGVIIGGLVIVGGLTLAKPALGEAMQFHALVNLGLAVVAVGGVVAAKKRPYLGPVGLALAGAGTTVFLGLAGLVYFPYGPSLLPIAEWFGEAISFV